MSDLNFIVILIVIGFACIGIVTVLFEIMDYYTDKHRYQRITLEKFKELYEASPGKWELCKNTVLFIKSADEYHRKWIVFGFDLKDRYYYHKWKRIIEKQQRNEKYSKELQEVISTIQGEKEK
jgi:hypothetical protein